MKNIYSLSNVRKAPKKNLGSRLRRSSLIGLMISALLISGFMFNPIASAGGYSDTAHWVGTWATSPQGLANSGVPDVGEFDNQTVRQIMRVSIEGKVLRVRFSNEFGEEPLVIGAARIALSAGEANIVPGTSRQLTFGGESSVNIPPGAPALSDPVKLHVPPLGDLAISVYLPNLTTVTTYHRRALQTAYISDGDETDTVALPMYTTAVNWFFLSSVEVLASEEAAAIVTLGDSITDGTNSTVDANARWPNFLAVRLQARYDFNHLAVLDQGISGNRVLHDFIGDNALARFDRDVLRQPGVKYVVVMLGINDIGFSQISGFEDQAVSADEIIAGHRQLIARAHELGLTIYGATLTPFEGAFYFTDEGEVKRQAVNHWIRTSGEYDGVIDFDKVIRDPEHPTMFLPEYNSGDNLHPNDAGYEAMGNSVKLRLFTDTGFNFYRSYDYYRSRKVYHR
jgi:lysophospholipase L1-like esterase